jgi:hypothetical protein
MREGQSRSSIEPVGTARRVFLRAMLLGTVSVVGLFDAPSAWCAIDGREIDVRAHGAIFDGRDNTAAIVAAIAKAVVVGAKDVLLPAGDALISATIVVPPGVRLLGQGRNATRIHKTADFGDLLQFGSSTQPYQSGGATGFWAYHDYGAGPFPPSDPALVTHPCTKGAIINAFQPSHCIWNDLWLTGGEVQWRSYGGVSNFFTALETQGVWDPAHPALRCSPASIVIDGDLKHIPTDFDFVGCWARGTISPVRAIAWPGGHTSTATVQNIGAADILYIRCCEGLRWHGGYLGGAANNGVRLHPRAGGIVTGVDIRGAFVDACGLAGLMLDNQDGTVSTDITWAPSEHNGQFNGLCGVSDSYSTLKTYSVVGLNLAGFYRAFIGPVADLKCANSVLANVSGRGWNALGFYDKNAGGFAYDAAFKVADTCVAIVIDGLLGGGLNGDGSNNHDDFAVRYTSRANSTGVIIKAALGRGTAQAGAL